jgi:uncharacterized protein
MTAAPLHMAGERLMLDPAGAVYWPARRMLIAADLHLEKGTAFARRGMLLPPYDTALTLDGLALLRRRYAPAMLVALGDSFHDRAAALRLNPADRARLLRIAEGLDLVWITGNHDPDPPETLPGRSCDELACEPFTLRHIPRDGVCTDPEMAGHLHPKAQVQTRGQTISRPCFIADDTRMILPAFGTYTGGLDVRDPAIAGLYPRGAQLFLLGRDRVFAFRTAPAPRARMRQA